jgi:hypothetical protein
MTGCERNEVSCSLTTHSLSLRVGRQSDAAIHRVLYASWSTVDRHGLRPRGDKMRSDAVCGSITTRSCHCKERAERGTRQSIVVSGLRADDGARVLAHTDLQGITSTLVIQINAPANRE